MGHSVDTPVKSRQCQKASAMSVNSKMSDTDSSSSKNDHCRMSPPIPHDRPERRDSQKGQHHSCKLRNDPASPTSPVCELIVPCFSTGTCEQWILFRENLDEVIHGQNVTTAKAKFLVARRLSEGDALATFNDALEVEADSDSDSDSSSSSDSGSDSDTETETDATFKKCLDAVRDAVFPARASLMQKCHMRRFLRKKQGITARNFVSCVVEINSHSPSFLPINDVKPEKLPEDELLDLLECGVPDSWQKNMMLQNHNPLNGTLEEFISFCECSEQVEAQEFPKSNSQGKKKETKDPKKANKREHSDDQCCYNNAYI